MQTAEMVPKESGGFEIQTLKWASAFVPINLAIKTLFQRYSMAGHGVIFLNLYKNFTHKGASRS